MRHFAAASGGHAAAGRRPASGNAFQNGGTTAAALRHLTVLLCAAVAAAAVRPQAGDAGQALDRYGGTREVRARATGFFRAEVIGGRWWLVTPEGHGFLSAGVNHVDYKEDYSSRFVKIVTGHLRDWGFNTIGWSQESMNPVFEKGKVAHSRGWGPAQYRAARMPYVHLIRFTDIEWYADERFPDVFGPAFAAACDRLASGVCRELRDDPFLLGYFYSDTPNWPLWAEKAGATGIDTVARRYYDVIRESIRRHDPNHLLLGDRLKANAVIPSGGGRVRGVLDPVLDAMRGRVDVLSLEYYGADEEFEENIRAWSARAGMPVLLADSAFLAPTDALRIAPGSAVYAPDQSSRGELYRQFARRVYSNPRVIGWHWCAFGRSRGRRSGLLDGNDRPYEDCVAKMRAFNRNELYSVGMSARERETP